MTNLVNKLAEAQEVAKENTEVHQKKMKEYYDQKATPTKLKEGDKVFLYLERTPPNLSRKLTHKYVGPYYIARFVQNSTVKLRKVDNDKLLKAPVHVDRLKKCIDPAVRPEEEITDITDDLPDLCDGEVNEDEFQPLGATPTDFQGNDENDDNSDYYMKRSYINVT